MFVACSVFCCCFFVVAVFETRAQQVAWVGFLLMVLPDPESTEFVGENGQLLTYSGKHAMVWVKAHKLMPRRIMMVSLGLSAGWGSVVWCAAKVGQTAFSSANPILPWSLALTVGFVSRELPSQA